MSKLSELLRALIDGTEVEIIPTTKTQTYLVACINGTGSEGLPEPTTVLGGLLCELADKLAGGSPTPTGKPLKILEIGDDGVITKVSYSGETVKKYAFYTYYSKDTEKSLFNPTELILEEGVTTIYANAISMKKLTKLVLPSTLYSTMYQGVYSCTALKEVYFMGKPKSFNYIAEYTFSSCNNITDVYVPWGEGEVSTRLGFPETATIHYNWTPEE